MSGYGVNFTWKTPSGFALVIMGLLGGPALITIAVETAAIINHPACKSVYAIAGVCSTVGRNIVGANMLELVLGIVGTIVATIIGVAMIGSDRNW